MIQNNKWQLFFCSIVILLPMILGLFLWRKLPTAIIVMPLVLLALYWLCVLFTILDPKNQEQNQKVIRMVLWIIPVISLLASGSTYAIVLGIGIDMSFAVRVLFGLLFIVIGNYMPKCKQNHTIGIKVRWSLRNEENWNKTHRFSGKIWVLGGFLILMSLLIPLENIMYGLLIIILLLAFMPLLYSYLYYRRQLREGTATKAILTSGEKKVSVICLLIVSVLFIISGILVFSGNVKVQYNDTSFTLEVSYWTDATINYADINKIEFRQEDDPGERIMGFGGLRLLAGDFRNEEFDTYTRYSYAKCDSCIVLSVNDEIVVINGKTKEDTKEIYEQLKERINN